jgi:hypothetical protein
MLQLIGLAAPDACGDDVRTVPGYDLVVETGMIRAGAG